MGSEPTQGQAGAGLDRAIFGDNRIEPPKGDALKFAYRGRGRDIVGLAALNALLNIITLTLYRFWGKTRVRQHILSRVEINSEPMEYIGTGWEMFKGFLIVLFVLLAPSLAIILGLQFFAPAFAPLAIGFFYLLFIFLASMAVYTARRYRFSRTTWRGIRFAMSGSGSSYSWAAIGYAMLTSLTLGWFAPAADVRLSRRLWEETTYGGKPVRIVLPDQGLAGPAYPAFAVLWIVAVVGYFGLIGWFYWLYEFGLLDPEFPSVEGILYAYAGLLGFAALVGLLSIPYQAALLRIKADMLGFDHARFDLRATSGSLLGLQVTNVLILIFTLGFGQPIVSARTFRYIVGRLTSTGVVDFESIAQTKDRGPRSGEGLADAFDIGGF